MAGTHGLLERDREVKALVAAVAAAAAGRGGAVLVHGEAGIGKSALISKACEHATRAGVAVLSARGGELESEFAWGVVRQLFDATVARSAADELAGLFGGAAALARPALGIGATASVVDASYATLHGLYWLTVNLAQRQPLLVTVDDVHWSDAPSVRFLAHLLPRVAELPVLVVLASRPPATEPGPGADLVARLVAEPALPVLNVAALSEEASVALVRSTLSPDATTDFCVACHEVSGGNPFLLHAMLLDLSDEDVPPTAVSVDHVRRMTPAAVSASVLVRLARQPAQAVELARAVAVLSVGADLRLVRLLAGLTVDEAVESAAALIRAGILTGDTTLAFVHPLVRSAVYSDLSGPERSRWHDRAARLLAHEGAPVEQYAPHLWSRCPTATHGRSNSCSELALTPGAAARPRSPPTTSVGRSPSRRTTTPGPAC